MIEKLQGLDPADLARLQGDGMGEVRREGPDFAEALTGAFEKAGAAEKSADDAAQRFAAGDPKVGIHEVVIGAEKANIAVRYAVTLKNKVIEAYRELMNTPL